jgi:ATP-binding cassette, subfamily B, bacterial HlyB/CyaB
MPDHRLHSEPGTLLEPSGLCALVEIALRLGIESTVQHLSRSYVFQGAEPSSVVLATMARDLGLEPRIVDFRWADLPALRKTLPAILRLRDGSSLILEAVQQTAAGIAPVLRDPRGPADALVTVDEAALTAQWDGELLLLKRRYSLLDEQRPFGFGWLFGQVMRERRIFHDIAWGAIFSTFFALAPPFLFMIVIDRVIVNQSYSTLEVISGVLLLLIIFETALSYLRRRLVAIATTRIDARLNIHIFERLLSLPMDYFETHSTGEITTRLAQIWRIRNFLTGQLFGTFLEAVPLLGLIPVMLILQWRLALIVFGMAIIIFVIVAAFLRPLAERTRRVTAAEHVKFSHLVESVYGMKTIKSLALEARRRHEWDIYIARSTLARHELAEMANYPQTLSLPFERAVYSGTMMLGAYLMLSQPEVMYPGTLIAFAMLSMRLLQPLVHMAHLQQDLAEARGAIHEIAGVMNAPSEQMRAGSGLRLPIKGDINFQGVSFRYKPGTPRALDAVSFSIPRGTMFGIMGRSGSGKTTVTRLLQGLNPDYEGIIKVDGMDLREIDLTHLRTNIGVVPQENFLFTGSVRENIGMARSNATLAEIVRAAQMAGAEEFIERMPKGYDTRIEEGAANLSGGQRQRIAIARALLIDPPVLVLDEATSALDAESEAIINANLRRIAQGRTIICISHRLSMLVPADAILVLERGQVYDIGRHDELLYRCDIYKHMWHQQNRHVERSASNVQLAIAHPPEA